MKLSENKSQIWFKVLTIDGSDLDNEMKKWPLPEGNKKTEWLTSNSAIGTCIVNNPKIFMQRNNRAFVVELSGQEPAVEFPGIAWVHKLRLIREATNLDLKRFNIHRAIQQRV